MYDADAIEAINFEQLATVTDRMLLRGRPVSKRRRSLPARAALATQAPVAPFLPLGRGSEPKLPPPAFVRAAAASRSALPYADGSQYEPTVVMPAATRSQVFAFTVVIPALVGIAVGFAALL